MILADVHITYLAPIYFGEHIKVGVHISKLGNKSMTWAQNIVDAKTGKELSKGEVVLVTYDYKEEKTINIPHEWREKIKAKVCKLVSDVTHRRRFGLQTA